MNDYAGLDELLARALRGAPSIGPDFESAEMMATSSSSSLSSSGSGGGLEAVYLEEEEHGLTALYAAVLRGDERAAEALLAKGAMPENGGCRGVPPLFSAAARGNADLVRLLLKHGADPNKEERKQRLAPIHIAADKGHVEAIEALLEAGVAVDQKATQGDMTPLHHACSTGRLEAVKLLLDKGAAVDGLNNPGNTGLILAAGRGHGEVVDCLVSRGANVNAHCKRDGLTALHAAACFGHPDVARKLIAAGAAVDAAFEPFRHTPLHLAASKGQAESVKVLLECGADPNARNKPGATPLRLVASAESEMVDKKVFRDVAGLLLESKADINSANDQGNTPLHALVTKQAALENICFCLQFGADANYTNKAGKSPFDLAPNGDIHLVLMSFAEDRSTQGVVRERTASVSLSSPNLPSPRGAAGSEGSPLSPEIVPRARAMSLGGSFERPENWEADESVSACRACNASFILWRRRHHCRSTCPSLTHDTHRTRSTAHTDLCVDQAVG
ncbi:ankyrin 2,3/unc44, putative [Acanthamoeba castellanii str. Neff]|uniref:Ankyrin 2,3/unc44, putative n=1 Tax=Acanthamoeba castellanii (strain ATCC 30010 / Neff) TaxID=1257118 RepID=L8GZX4_ACACF|nr:ankyrin 2,3/unc44, putative [Acanthamoeba castellanii str. Neff]ELR18058.1 ankyrin 2,3/unc44, putative [Acanthamoeba castellanii str. Neff]